METLVPSGAAVNSQGHHGISLVVSIGSPGCHHLGLHEMMYDLRLWYWKEAAVKEEHHDHGEFGNCCIRLFSDCV